MNIKFRIQQSSCRWLSLLLLLAFTACTRPDPPLVVGYINSPRVMQQYHGTAAKRRQLEVYAKHWQRSLDSLMTTLSGLPSAEQERQVSSYRVVLQQKLQAASQQADHELLQEVNKYLNTYGKNQKYDFILGANESGNLVYAAPGRDLTPVVVRGLNQQYDQLHTQTP